MPKPLLFDRLLAIGVGLIGGSICLAAKKHGLVGHVLGHSRKLETAHEALRLGIVDECIVGPGDSNLRSVDAVVLSVPVQQYQQVLTQFLPVLPANCLIFDAGSTKSDVVEVLQTLEPQFPGLSARFVLAHPIAGGESHGPAAAAPHLFEDRNCVICPLPQTQQAHLQKVEQYWTRVGARLRTMNALDHDEMFGAVSHLPHLLAFAYVASVLRHPKGEQFMKEGGAGYRDFTRIAASSPEMWADIFQNNSKALLSTLGEFERTIAQLRQSIEEKDRKALEGTLAQAASYRSAWKPQ
ncbi:MAG TPA: prephenate dehydrogenase/arogenate dehydrogenase family protein [Limnobacter sp.]|nr:prephenate dehydrogenase/arogenate dehydrogenase family protein [Limnobacter sp.]